MVDDQAESALQVPPNISPGIWPSVSSLCHSDKIGMPSTKFRLTEKVSLIYFGSNFLPFVFIIFQALCSIVLHRNPVSLSILTINEVFHTHMWLCLLPSISSLANLSDTVKHCYGTCCFPTTYAQWLYSFLDPMTAPQSVHWSECPQSTNKPANFTKFSPAGPIESTAMSRSLQPFSCFTKSAVL